MSRHRNNRTWADKSNKYVLAFYRKHFKGKSPKEVESKDTGLYYIIRKRGLLKHLPRKTVQKPTGFYSNMTDPQLIAYYQTHFPDVTIAKLQRAANGLWGQLRSRGLEDVIARAVPGYARMTKKELMEIYQTEYNGLSPGELIEKGGHAATLSKILTKRKLTKFLPTRFAGYSSMTKGVMFSLYYSNFDGLNWSKLLEQAPGFAQELRKKGWTYILPRERKQTGFWKIKTEKELKDMYKQKYDGYTPTQLMEKEPGLMLELRRRKLDNIVKRKQTRHGGFWGPKSDKYVIDYYNKHFKGKASSELDELDLGLIKQMRKRGLTGILRQTRKPMGFWKNKSDAELLKYCKEHYHGLEITKVAEKEPGLGNILRERGLTEKYRKKKYPNYRPPGFWKNKTNNQLTEIYKTKYDGAPVAEIPRQLYFELNRRSLDGIITLSRRPRNFWRNKTNEWLIDYYKKNHPNASHSELIKRDAGFLGELIRRDLIRILATTRMPRGYWKKFSNNELIELYKKEFDGLAPKELHSKASGLQKELTRRKLAHIMPTNRPGFRLMDRGELYSVYYSNFGGKSPREVEVVSPGYLVEMRRRKFDGIMPRQSAFVPRNFWVDFTDDEMVSIYHSNYGSLTPKRLEEANNSIYQQMQKRKLLHIMPRHHPGYASMSDQELIGLCNIKYKDMIWSELPQGLVRVIREHNLTHILNYKKPEIHKALANDAARTLLHIGIEAGNGYVSDAVQVLTEVYPAIKVLFSYRKVDVESLRPYIGDFKTGNALSMIPVLLDKHPELTRSPNLENFLFKYARDQYQRDFNSDPERTLSKIQQQIGAIKSPYVSNILEKVHKFYLSIAELQIPGAA